MEGKVQEEYLGFFIIQCDEALKRSLVVLKQA